MDLILTKRLRLLTEWVHKGGKIEFDRETIISLYLRFESTIGCLAMSDSLDLKLVKFLLAHNLILHWETGTDFSADPSFRFVIRPYLELGIYRDRPELSLILAQEKNNNALLEIALSRGYPLHPEAMPRALTLAHVPAIRKRFKNEWKITAEDIQAYKTLFLRTPESDAAIELLTGTYFRVTYTQ